MVTIDDSLATRDPEKINAILNAVARLYVDCIENGRFDWDGWNRKCAEREAKENSGG